MPFQLCRITRRGKPAIPQLCGALKYLAFDTTHNHRERILNGQWITLKAFPGDKITLVLYYLARPNFAHTGNVIIEPCASVLERTLKEEYAADKTLNGLAEGGVNRRAA